MFQLPRIYPILNINPEMTRDSARLMIGAYIDAGIDLFQVRAKGLSDRDFCSWVEFCLEQSNSSTVRLVVNDRPDIAVATGAAGVHLGQTDLSPLHVRQAFPEELIVGLSCHSESQIKSAPLAALDYVALGPIFPTKTKANPDPTIGLEALAKWRKLLTTRNSSLPLVAIGGIELSRIGDVLAHGADSVALISALGGPENIHERLQEAHQNAA